MDRRVELLDRAYWAPSHARVSCQVAMNDAALAGGAHRDGMWRGPCLNPLPRPAELPGHACECSVPLVSTSPAERGIGLASTLRWRCHCIAHVSGSAEALQDSELIAAPDACALLIEARGALNDSRTAGITMATLPASSAMRRTATETAQGDNMTTTYTDEPDPPSLRPLSAERPWRFSWGAVLAGASISLGLWLLLHILGLGAGLTAINPDDLGSLRGVGMGTGIWSLIVPMVAMFLGGFAAAKVAGPITRMSGAIHGAVLWSLATVASGLLVMSVVAALVGGAARLGGAAASAAGQAIQGAPTQMLSQTGITAEDLLAPVNERLRASGRPEVTSEQLGAVARDALRTVVREGRVDRELLTSSVAQNTGLSQKDANQVASQVEQEFNQRAVELRQGAQQVGATALQAAETTGKGLLGLFFAMLLGLVAAIAGTLVGVTRAQLAVAERASARAERLVGRHA